MSGIPTSSSATSGFSARGQLHRLAPAGRQADDVDPRVGRQQRRGALAHQPVVVGDRSRARASIRIGAVIAPEVLSGLGGGLARLARAGRHRASCRCSRAPRWRRCARRCACTTTALYLPDADGYQVLRRYVGSAAAEELSFDPEAWQLAIASGSPIVLREPATWLVANPFTPAAGDWVILPLVTGEQEMVGVVIASATSPIRIDPLSGTVLSLLGLQLSAGITTARLRRELLQRRDGARAAHAGGRGPRRAGAVPRASRAGSSRCPSPTASACSEAVDAAHRLVRARLQELSVGRARRPARGDRGRRASAPDAHRARVRPRRGRARGGHARRADRLRGAGQRRRARARRAPSRSPTPPRDDRLDADRLRRRRAASTPPPPPASRTATSA